MEPKGNSEVGKPVSGATPLSKREGGLVGVLRRGEFVNHLRARRADSTTAGARLINTLFGEVNKNTLVDAAPTSPTPKTEITELSNRPPNEVNMDRMGRELRPDFDKVYPEMSKWLIGRLKRVLEIKKSNPEMCEKGGVFANEYLLAEAMMGDAGTIAEVKVREYFKDPQAYATTMTMIEDTLATLAFSQGKYVQTEGNRGQRVNADANAPERFRMRGTLARLAAAVAAGTLSGFSFIAARQGTQALVLALGSAITGAAIGSPDATANIITSVAAGAGSAALANSGINRLEHPEGNQPIRKLEAALRMVQADPAAVEAVKVMYGIDPSNIYFDINGTIQFTEGNTNSDSWDAAKQQLPYLSRMRQDYYRHVHRLDPCQVDGMPEQYLADDPDGDTNLRIEQTGSKAQAEIMQRFNKILDARNPPGIIGIPAAERLKLMTEARREWLGEKMNAQFDKSSLKKDAAKRALEKVMISTQIDKLKRATGTPPVEGERRKSLKDQAHKSVQLHEKLIAFTDVGAEPESLIGYLQPVEALAKNRRDLAGIAAKYARTSVPTSAEDCAVLIQDIRRHIEVANDATHNTLYQVPTRQQESLMNIKTTGITEAKNEATTRFGAIPATADKQERMRLTKEIQEEKDAKLLRIDQQYNLNKAPFDSDIAALTAIAAGMVAERNRLSQFGKEAQAIKSTVEKLTVRPGGGADRLGIPTARLILFGTPGNSFQELMAATNQTLIPIADRDKPEYQKELIRAIADAKAEARVNAAIGRAAAGAALTRQEQVYDLAMTYLGHELLGMTDQEVANKLVETLPHRMITAADPTAVPPTPAVYAPTAPLPLAEIAACRRAMEGVLQARSKAYKETLAIVGYQKEQAVVDENTVETDCDAKGRAYEIIRNRFLEADRGKASYEIATKMVRDFATMFEARAFPAANDPDRNVFLAGELVGFPERSITNLLEAIFKYRVAPENSTIKDPNVSFSAVNEALGGAEMPRTLVAIFVHELHLDTLPPPAVPPITRLTTTYADMMNQLRAANGVTAFTVPQMQKVVSGIINHVCEKATFGNI